MPTRSRPEVFVGRAAELGRLTALAEQAAGGTGAVVLLAGEAGAGKTTLVEQLGRQTALPVHWASCWEDEGQPPYWAWTQLLRELPDPVRPGSPLAVLLPEVGSAPATDRFTVHDAAVDALAAAGPAVLVVDDLHWADPSSVALLLHLARRVRRLPLLVLATYRDTDVRPGSALDGALGPLARLAEVVAVPGLAPEEVAELLATVAGAVPAGLAAQVHLESDGNALFATELARLVAQRGQAREVPAALGPVVVERLSRFAPATLEALEVAAVLGLRSAPHELAEVLQVPAEQLLARLEEPTRVRVLRPGPDVVFTHALVRAVLLQRMAPAVRAGWHARCVEVLAAVPDRERLGRLAAHALEAVPVLGPGPALAWARGAARTALSSFGAAEAARHLDTVARLAPPAERPRALLELGRARQLAGDTGGALEALQSAWTLADGADLCADVALSICQATPLFAPPGAVVALLDEALQGCPDAGRQAALTAQRWTRLVVHGPRSEAAERWAAEQVAQAPDELARGRALAFQYLVLHRCDRVLERLAVARAEASLADTDPETAANAGVHLLLAGLELADRGLLDEGLRRLEEVAERDRRPVRALFRLTRRATVAVLDGRYDDAVGALEAAEALAAQADLPEFGPGFMSLRAVLAGDVGPAYPPEVLDRLGGMFRMGSLMHASGVMALRGHLEDGHQETAAALLPGVLAGRPRTPEALHYNGLASLVLLADVVAVQGPPELAAELIEVLLPYADRTAVLALAVVSVGPVALALAGLAGSLGRPADADRWFAQALDVAGRLGARPWQARIQSRWAAALAGRDPARASRLLAEATATATELGMHRLLTQRVQVPVLARDGDGWLVTDADRTVRLRDSKGLRYLADLLAHPGVERHVLDLVALTDGPGQRHGLGDAGPVLDPQAKAAYRARLAALRAELDDADAAGDVDGSARAQAELAALTAELSRAVGLGGRDRVVGSAAEKARLNVTRAVRTALARIAEDLPTLGARLDRDVRTGLHCVFVPD